MKTPEASWIAHRKMRPQARIRLFCFPYAGGGASLFRTWGQELPDTIEVCPVQMPGKEGRWAEPPYSRLEPLIDALCDGLKPLMGMPYALFGYSMGALIAFEFAREWRRRGWAGPDHLFVAARRSPRRPDPRPPIYHLPDEEFIRELATYEGTSEEVLQNPDMLAFYLPILRADFELCETYGYSPDRILDSPLSAYGGSGDADVQLHDLESWSAETTSFSTVRLFDGDHFFVHSCRAALLQAIAEDLFSHTFRSNSRPDSFLDEKPTW
jgi:medium-chain acyl-[acyl-carrier-protein] hydrolase